jgi:hypothetical protein
MIHDGSYEAHTINEDGKLLYDPKKDKRFSYYFAERHKYKASDSSKFAYNSSKTDKKYNEQKALYDTILKEINEERKALGEELFNDGDIIDQAYSGIERNSFKSFTDTIYGYYDKDMTSEIHNT